jgi:thiol-disulfide isomerase/thioredoxin
MIKKIFILLFILCLTSCSQPQGYDSHKNPINLSDYQGKWLLVNYWASWCKPCVTEMPALNAFYESHKTSVMVLGISFDGADDQELNDLAKERQINYPLLSSINSTELEEQDFRVLPVSFLFNPQGKLVKTLRGPQTEQSLRDLIT